MGAELTDVTVFAHFARVDTAVSVITIQAYKDNMAISNREKQLIERFLAAYNADRRAGFRITAWPDEVDRTGQAVDALAADSMNDQIAIEHTLLQPFVGERRDSHVFDSTVAPLDQKQSLILPNFDVNLCFRVGAVPTGVNWNTVTGAVEAWYMSACQVLPVGPSKQRIPGLPFDLDVDVRKEPAPGGGHFFISRWMPSESVEAVVRQALTTKLPKLVAAQGKLRLLLLEKNSLPRSCWEIGDAIEKLRPEFSGLSKIDEVWVVDTVAWDSEDYTPLYLVWPLDRALEFQARRRRA